MDAGTQESAEILPADPPADPPDSIAMDREARRAISIEVDPSTGEDVERRLDAQRHAIATFFDLTLSEREGSGFLRYEPGGFYRPHRDRADAASWPGAARRRIALVVFLNDDFSGGTLRILEDRADLVGADLKVGPYTSIDTSIEVVPRAGTLVAFPAAALHEVLPVVAGTRDVIVDWFY